jgi:hypothetical protein
MRKPTKLRTGTRFPNICRHAAELGVNRASLYRVLTGEWDLPRLLTRYRALVSKEKEAATANPGGARA